MPFIISTRDGSTTVVLAALLNRIGTRMEAPNIAKRCCRLKGIAFRKGTLSSTWMISLVAMWAPPGFGHRRPGGTAMGPAAIGVGFNNLNLGAGVQTNPEPGLPTPESTLLNRRDHSS